MDTEARLRALESRYRHALSATVVAKAQYLALVGEPGTPPTRLQYLRQRWQTLASRKRAIAARMADIENAERRFVIGNAPAQAPFQFDAGLTRARP